MDVLKKMAKYDHEQIAFWHDTVSGLRSIIAIHDTTLGPALGGARMWHYAKEKDAFRDVLRLSRTMTYKNAAAGLNLGGGKAVIIGDPSIKSEALYRSFGRFIQTLGGRYITAQDVNTSIDDLMIIRNETEYVSGLPEHVGGAGDPSPFTALGTLEGIKISVLKRLGMKSLNGITVAVQGLGSVGSALCSLLHQKGAELIVTDTNEGCVQNTVKQFGAMSVGAEEIYSVDADVFAPCALGGIINDKTIPQFKFSVIAGAANNQLHDEGKHGKILKEKNILYAPDYIINAGGVINCYYEVIKQYNRESVETKVKGIYDTLARIYDIAEKESISQHIVAARFAEKRIELIGKIKRTYMKGG